MKTKVILFDIDGVLIKLPHYFSKELENKGYKNAEKNLNSFFHSDEFCQCLRGKMNIEKIIEPYLKRFKWKDTVVNYLNQQFSFEIQYLDQNVITAIQLLKKGGMKCFLSTDQEKKRSNFLLDKVGFRSIFDGYFISSDIGFMKCQDGFWIDIIAKLEKENIKPEEIVFFDDKQVNINVASRFCLKAFLFTDMNQFIKNIDFLKIKTKIRHEIFV